MGRAAVAVPSGHRVELLGCDRRARPRRRGALRAVARRVLRRAHLRAARHDRHRRSGRTSQSTDGWPRCTRRVRIARRCASTPWARPRSAGPRHCPAAAGSCRPRTTTTASRRCCVRGGELDGTRLLGPRTVALMASNHLPGGVDLEAFGRPLFAETTFDGVGFGLGVSVTIDPVKTRVPVDRRRVRLGWRGEHRVLGRPGRGHHRGVPHPAAAVEHLADPASAQADGEPGAGGLTAGAAIWVVLVPIRYFNDPNSMRPLAAAAGAAAARAGVAAAGPLHLHAALHAVRRVGANGVGSSGSRADSSLRRVRRRPLRRASWRTGWTAGRPTTSVPEGIDGRRLLDARQRGLERSPTVRMPSSARSS